MNQNSMWTSIKPKVVTLVALGSHDANNNNNNQNINDEIKSLSEVVDIIEARNGIDLDEKNDGEDEYSDDVVSKGSLSQEDENDLNDSLEVPIEYLKPDFDHVEQCDDIATYIEVGVVTVLFKI